MRLTKKYSQPHLHSLYAFLISLVGPFIEENGPIVVHKLNNTLQLTCPVSLRSTICFR